MNQFIKYILLAFSVFFFISPAMKTEAATIEGLTFNGQDSQYIETNNLNINQTNGAKTTVEFWMKWNGQSGQMPISFSEPSHYYDLVFSQKDTCITFGINTGQGDVVGFCADTTWKDTWVHIAAVLINGTPNETNVKIYANGVQKTLAVYPNSKGQVPVFAEVQPTMYISSFYGSGSNYFFNGGIADVRVWNGERTVTQIQGNMNKILVGNESNLLGYWRTDPITTDIVYDQSTYNNNGTAYGFAPSISLTASSITDLGMDIKWNQLNSALGYELKRDNVLVYDGPNLNYKENTLVSDTEYPYSVKAKNNNGKSVQATGTFKTNAGSLEILSVPINISMNPITLNGVFQKSFGTFTDKIVVKDTRKVRDGWHLVVQASNLSGNSRVFPSEKLQLQPASSVVQTAGLIKNKPVIVNQKQAIDSGISKTLIQADPNNTGYGIYEISLPSNALELTINPEAYKGNYSSNVTWTLLAGS
jgi:hypothetical protein